LFNGELVGYAMSDRMTTTLVSQALFRAVAAKRPAKYSGPRFQDNGLSWTLS
jgi:transposase InsO family protein